MTKLLLALAFVAACVDPAPTDALLPARPELAYPVVHTGLSEAGETVYLMTPAELETLRAQVREASAWMRRAEVTLSECGFAEGTP